jgi:hypothetical protein
MSNDEERERLRDRGTVYVTAAAAHQYAEARGQPEETARRELTALLAGAYQTTNGGWRRRIQGRQIDVTAHVSIEGELAVVVAVQSKRYLGGAQQRRARTPTDTPYPMPVESIAMVKPAPHDPFGVRCLDWAEHEASGTDDLTMRVADVDVDDTGGASLHVHRDLGKPSQGWRYDVEIEAMIEPDEDCVDEDAARRRAHATTLEWAERLVVTLKSVTA